MKNLVIFGDSWSWGQNDVDPSETGRIKDRYSALVARHYNSNVIDFSLPGIYNRRMSYLLMDVTMRNKLDPNTDFVIFILTAWTRVNNISVPGEDTPEWLKRKNLDLREIAYAQIVDYNFIINLLEAKKFQYVIGWNWNELKDFCKYLKDEQYHSSITNNHRFLDKPFISFTTMKSLKELTRHPSEEEHKLYAEYLIDKIKPHNDRM